MPGESHLNLSPVLLLLLGSDLYLLLHRKFRQDAAYSAPPLGLERTCLVVELYAQKRDGSIALLLLYSILVELV